VVGREAAGKYRGLRLGSMVAVNLNILPYISGLYAFISRVQPVSPHTCTIGGWGQAIAVKLL